MRRFFLLLLSGLLFSGISVAERSDVMMAWPYLVQLDFKVFHGQIVKICTEKFSESAPAFEAALVRWSNKNSSAILEFRKKLKVRFMALNGLSDADASTEIERRGKAVTAMYLESISGYVDEDWRTTCNGQYVTESLRQMDFVSFLTVMTPVIPYHRADEIFPKP
jgi:hypothetical protein